MLLTVGSTLVYAQGKHRGHRHRQQITVVADSDRGAITAYSDSVSAALTADHADAFDRNEEDAYDPIRFRGFVTPSDFFHLWRDIVGGWPGSFVLVLLSVFLSFLFLILPFIIVIMILRYFIRRHNDKVRLAEKALEAGQPIPEKAKSEDRQTDEYVWKKGVRNVAIGVGLMFMFGFMNSPSLIGIGALVLCMGAGQMVIARTTQKKQDDGE